MAYCFLRGSGISALGFCFAVRCTWRGSGLLWFTESFAIWYDARDGQSLESGVQQPTWTCAVMRTTQGQRTLHIHLQGCRGAFSFAFQPKSFQPKSASFLEVAKLFHGEAVLAFRCYFLPYPTLWRSGAQHALPFFFDHCRLGQKSLLIFGTSMLFLWKGVQREPSSGTQ